MKKKESDKDQERTLSLVSETQAFPDLPGNGNKPGDMAASPPGQFKSNDATKLKAPPDKTKQPGKTSLEMQAPENYKGFLLPLYKFKMQVKAWYLTDFIQLLVAGVIFLNFIVVMFSVTQFVLDNKEVEDFCDVLDKIFIYFFLVELGVNMITSAQGVNEAALVSPWIWQWEFWVGDNWSWNWFDFIVIIVPVALANASWASSIRILRLFRVIRVLKSIAKFEALQVVASSVSRSMSGVGATAIFIIITVCMYAIIGVEMFGRIASGSCEGDQCIGNADLDGVAYTAMSWQQRQVYYNANCEEVPLWKYFGNLRRSMLTMFVFTTVEGWPDIGWCLGKTYAGGSAFCTSFIIITALLMANIVVAIFTNKMEEAQEAVEAEQKELRRQRQATVDAYTNNKKAMDNAQGVDLDGDGKIDEYVLDLDGDGVADAVMSAKEMEQATGGGGNIENMGAITNLLNSLQSEIKAIGKKVDTLMRKNSP